MSTGDGTPFPIFDVGNQYVELAIATMVIAPVVRDVDCGGGNHSAGWVDELELEGVARAIVARELGFVALGAFGPRNRFGVQPKHGLNKFITDAGTETAARSAEVGLDALEVRPADDDAVQLQSVTHRRQINAAVRRRCVEPRVSDASSARIALRLNRLVEVGLLGRCLRRGRLVGGLLDLEAELLLDELPYFLRANLGREKAHEW